MSRDVSVSEQLWRIWKRLGPHWQKYFAKAGLHLSYKSKGLFFQQMGNPVKVNFRLRGTQEFSRDGCRGIEPGDPARSLFYHILASPHAKPPVKRTPGRKLAEELLPDSDKYYPTMSDFEVIENYIYSARKMTLAEIRNLAGNAKIAIVVFAYEYAPAIDTVHGQHADLCFSRTGVGRVGNAPPHYVAKARGYFPDSGKRKTVHVVPARFGVFLAYQKAGDPKTIGPMRFSKGDDRRMFWVPLHKLFDGKECIKGIDIRLKIESHHVNEKIRRIHLALLNDGINTGWSVKELERAPFRITQGLASYHGQTGQVVPVPHRNLVQPARDSSGRLVGFPVPPGHRTLNASLWFLPIRNARRSPEFVHAKHKIVTEGKRQKLSYIPDTDPRNIDDVVKEGDYTAANFVDWTGDGWVRAECPSLKSQGIESVSAYSILAQPDFFPLVKQKDLMTWRENSPLKQTKESNDEGWRQAIPISVRNLIWPHLAITPEPLSNSRIPANLALRGARFDFSDQTITTIIGMNRKAGKGRPILDDPPRRESTLSCQSTGLFEPGWDTSHDFINDSQSFKSSFYLANYGLGSPYAEDTLICAAFSSYWPGAAPDVTRFFAPGIYPTSTPILDDQANWDGGHLPINSGSTTLFNAINYADYVRAIWNDKLDYGEFAHISLDEYKLRTLAAARVFQALGVDGEHPEKAQLFPFLSFRRPTEEEFAGIKRSGWKAKKQFTFRVEVATGFVTDPSWRWIPQIDRINPKGKRVLFVGPSGVAMPQSIHRGGFLVRRLV